MKMLLTATPRLLIPLLCLTLTACKETQQMQKQLAEMTTKITTLQAELVQMESQIAAYRTQSPVAVNEQAARQQSVQLAAGVVAVENEIAQTQAAILEAQTTLETAKKDLETLRAKAPR